MPNLITSNFGTIIANSFINTVDANSYYIFAGQNIPWQNDNNPPAPNTSLNETVFTIWDNMLFAKQLTSNNVLLMTNLNLWVSNTVYAFYDDQNSNLLDTNFIVTVDSNTSYDVFECLNNNGGIPSTYPPTKASTSENDLFYFTADGYQWKYLYSVDNTTYSNFATVDYIPYLPNSNTSGNAVPGAIDTIIVENGGSNFNAYANGFFQFIAVGSNSLIFTIDPTSSTNTGFFNGSAIKIVGGTGSGQQRMIDDYIVSGGFKNVIVDQPFSVTPDLTSQYEISPMVMIVGDGTGFQGRGIVNASSNTLASIEIANKGQNYSWANATVVSNTGFISLLQPNNAILRVIIGPSEGHGGNIPKELGINNVGISLTFANTESQTIPVNTTFRTFGLLSNPLFANVQLTFANTVGIFQADEIIKQTNTNATGYSTVVNMVSSIINITNATDNFVEGQIITGESSNASAIVTAITNNGVVKQFNTFDQRTRFNITLNGGGSFVNNEIVTQLDTFANGVVDESNSSFMAITNVRGVFDVTSGNTADSIIGSNSFTSANINAILSGDIIKNSGEILYIENMVPIQRTANTSELIKLVIGF